jgi:hypothetical protein
MAVIKSGVSPAQLTVDPNSQAARVTLYDINGNAQTFTLNANVTTLAQEQGNLQTLVNIEQQSITELLTAMLVELRIQNQIACDGFNLQSDTYDSLRNDRAFCQFDIRQT